MVKVEDEVNARQAPGELERDGEGRDDRGVFQQFQHSTLLTVAAMTMTNENNGSLVVMKSNNKSVAADEMG